MREYAIISPRFWTGETGKRLRTAGPEAQVVALYLLSCPASNMIGLYYLPLPTLCHETGLSEKGALKRLQRASEALFAFYDHHSETVWIPQMARFQVGESLKPTDNRVKSVEREVLQYRNSKFFKDFLAKYGEAYHLNIESPSEAPSKPLRSQEQEQDQEQDQEQEQETEDGAETGEPSTAAPPSGYVLIFDCDGNPKTWGLTQSQVDAWQADYPALNVLQEFRGARNWIDADPRRRKTAGGMKRFLVGWLNRSQNSGSRNAGAQSNGRHTPGPGQRHPDDIRTQEGVF